MSLVWFALLQLVLNYSLLLLLLLLFKMYNIIFLILGKDKEEGRYTYIEINPNESDLKERLLNTFVKYIYE